MSLDAAADAIAKGLVVGLPTDTVYGLAVDPINPEAVARLFEMKGRPAGKPIGILSADVEQADEIGRIEGGARELADAHWPGGLTLIVTPRVILSDWVGDQQRRTVGIRVPDHSVARRFLAMTGPLAVTSANRSGKPELLDSESAAREFGDEAAVYLEGRAPGGVPSSVVDVTGPEAVILREGPVRLV